MRLPQFLLTRFNVPVGYAPEGRGIAEAWLRHRFGLFEKFCLPSVLAQERPSFTWILMLDERTPARWFSRLRDGLAPAKFPTGVVAVKAWSETHFVEAIRKAAGRATSKAILTTRLDNDDAIAPGYLSLIAREARKLPAGRNYVINYAKGCRVSESGLHAVSHALNPFMSLLSPDRKLKTAFHANHCAMGAVGKVIELGRAAGEPILWMQVIHRHNISRRACDAAAEIDRRQIRHFPLSRGWRKLLH